MKRYKHRLKSYTSRIERLEEKARDLEDHVAETKEAMEKCEEEKNGLQEKMSAQKTEYLSALDDVSTLTKRGKWRSNSFCSVPPIPFSTVHLSNATMFVSL